MSTPWFARSTLATARQACSTHCSAHPCFFTEGITKIGYVARRDSRSRKGTAVCVGTVNGAIKPFEGEGPWSFRRTQAAGGACPGTRRPPHSKLVAGASNGLPHLLGIRYFEEGDVGCFYFDFYNGVISTTQCCRLRDAFLYACSRPTRVIELVGGKDFFTNGIHLNVIEAASDPSLESWCNINAIDDLVLEIPNTMSHSGVSRQRRRGRRGDGSPPIMCMRTKVWCSIRITRARADFMVPNIGLTHCQDA
jgi:hypothetical protein